MRFDDNTAHRLTRKSITSVHLLRAAYIFRILAHAELFGIFHLFTVFLEEFDYTARVQHALVTVLDNI